jgi:hypothetical protein
MELVNQRADADWLRSEYAASERRVCGLMGMVVASYRYRSQRSDEPLRTKLVELAREKPRFGYRRLHVLLGRAGERVNHKRVHRVYREAGLMIRRKKRKHCVQRQLPEYVGITWLDQKTRRKTQKNDGAVGPFLYRVRLYLGKLTTTASCCSNSGQNWVRDF